MVSLVFLQGVLTVIIGGEDETRFESM